MNPKPRILCVDDDPLVLEGIALQMRRHYEVRLAGSMKAGLEELAKGGPFQAVLSDMRMPGGDGAQFLTQVKERWPMTTRMLLTGQADMDSAIEAVNGGQIFRFLTKPCPPQHLKASFEAAVEHNRLVTVEKELIGKTLRGSLQALMDVLSLAQPEAFGRAGRIKKRASLLAARITGQGGAGFGWELDMAALLYHLGMVSVPAEIIVKSNGGLPLTPEEEKWLRESPRAAAQIIGKIPRLEGVAGLLNEVGRLLADPASTGSDNRAAQLLHLVVLADDMQNKGFDAQGISDRLRALKGRLESEWIGLLVAQLVEEENARIVNLELNELEVGMMLAEDIKSPQGTLLIARGIEITENFLARLRNLPLASKPEGFKVRLAVPAKEAVA